MKNYFFGLLMLLAVCSAAQTGPVYMKVKHTKGIYGVDARYLLSKEGKGAYVGYTRFFANEFFFEIGGETEFGKVGYTDYKNLLVSGKIDRSIFNIKKIVYLNGFISGRIGMEVVSLDPKINDEQGYYEQENPFTCSLGAGFLLEGYITSKFVLTAGFDQIIISRSIVGKQYFNGIFGIRYYLN